MNAKIIIKMTYTILYVFRITRLRAIGFKV